ncbi:ubiquitin carboxyl-terminal hydrolase 2 isoform X2 [Eurytemora carolleeae]|uniref:ubiquitin carboxyl-terminal hydrolase 2 isoform X2 n=1 Tax=Eurytemora carolleeae TaxID=1294199 RepID=UPI000C75B498|nr:ubiquitin carboxyl-terminal hydrolase 2 isoform X2 [Eurytemora carolleeae]|eukprot:XP_023328077.1 ubiquitin carboxyl-terminal hydrolase 2-like isoform X2 [Eurytemora affinis]
MSRYNGSAGSTYSSYRSPYLDSYTSSYSSPNYSLPSYESKFESLISRTDGKPRSRAGTSTRYDYLASSSNKYDYPSTISSHSSYSSNSYSTPSYSSSSSYASKPSYSSTIADADDLTKSYFAKYYNKAVPDALSKQEESSYPRASRALSVYLDDTSSSYSPALDVKPRTFRSTSVLGDITESSKRLSRLLSTDDDGLSKLTRRNSVAAPRSRFLDRDKDEDTGYTRSSAYSRYTVDREKDQDNVTSKYNGYSRFVDNETEESSPVRSSYRRYSTVLDDSTPTYKRDYTRAYGGRTDESNSSDSYKQNQNGENSCEKTGGSGATGGLKNLGNTCFMNSVIQCLSNTKLLCDFLLSDEYSNDINSNSSMKGSLIKAFATVVKSLWKPNARTVDPSTLKGAVQRFAPRFSGYNQEDSQEFLRYLLEGLHEDVNRVTVKPQSIHTEIDSNLSVEEQGMEAWKRYLRRDDSKLVDIFVGQLKSTLRCSSCDYESVTFEPFWDLSLPIPSRSGEISLHECLENFTKEEVMDGDEMPTCGRCKTRRRCTKFYSLYKLPKVLVVHLKRFSPTEKYRSKLSNSVTFPLTSFDVSKFSDCPGRSTYSCYAVSNHSGTLYSGHYTAYARNPKTSQWHYFNDSRVSSSSSGSVISNEAYLLFFELLS